MARASNGHNENGDGLLSGLRVIDCGTYVAGPAAATVMSDFGAEVIKIERPGGGDLWRLFSKLPGTAKSELDWCWVLTSRNKKSVALDLGRVEGLAKEVPVVGGRRAARHEPLLASHLAAQNNSFGKIDLVGFDPVA